MVIFPLLMVLCPTCEASLSTRRTARSILIQTLPLSPVLALAVREVLSAPCLSLLNGLGFRVTGRVTLGDQPEWQVS